MVKDTVDSINKGAGGFIDRLKKVADLLDFVECMGVCICTALAEVKEALQMYRNMCGLRRDELSAFCDRLLRPTLCLLA